MVCQTHGLCTRGHGHPALLVSLLSLVANEGKLLRQVHPAEEGLEARVGRTKPHRKNRELLALIVGKLGLIGTMP